MRDAQERAHAFLLHARFIQDVDTEAKLRSHFPSPFGHVRWRHVCTRLVCEVAGEVDRLAYDSAAFGATLKASFIRAIHNNDQFAYLPCFFVLGAILVWIKQRHERTFNHYRSYFLRISFESGKNCNRLNVLSTKRAHG